MSTEIPLPRRPMDLSQRAPLPDGPAWHPRPETAGSLAANYMTVLGVAAATIGLAYLVERAMEGRRAVRLATEYVERYLLAVERCDRLEARIEWLVAEIETLNGEAAPHPAYGSGKLDARR